MRARSYTSRVPSKSAVCAVSPNLSMHIVEIRIYFFASAWVAEVRPGYAILEKHSAARDAAEPTYFPRTGVDRRQARWGVVQPVGHHTVNVDGEGSNPSAPANFPL